MHHIFLQHFFQISSEPVVSEVEGPASVLLLIEKKLIQEDILISIPRTQTLLHNFKHIPDNFDEYEGNKQMFVTSQTWNPLIHFPQTIHPV
jgi:hypothetical protein